MAHLPPSGNPSAGDDAIELAAAAGLILDPWQQFCVRACLLAEPDGTWSSFEFGLECPRQNGKGAVLEAVTLAGLYLLDEHLITWTAHEFKTAQEAFRRMAALIRGSNFLFDRVKPNGIRTANGTEGIELRTGQRLRFLARSGGSGRGFTGDRVILDEAQDLHSKVMGALVPTMATRGDMTVGGPQIVYAGSAGDDESDVLAGLHDRAEQGASGLTLIQYAAAKRGQVPQLDIDDPDVQRSANPAMWGANPRIGDKYMREAKAAINDDDQYAREHLGIWNIGVVATPIPPDDFALCRDTTRQPEPDVVSLSVDVPPGGRSAVISGAFWREDGLPQTDVIEAAKGTRWAVQRLSEIIAKRDRVLPVVINPAHAAAALLPELGEAGIEVKLLTRRDYAAACGHYLGRIIEGQQLRHNGAEVLVAAADGARKLPVGDAWIWGRRDTSVNISPLVSNTQALHGLMTAEPEPPKREPRKARAQFV